MMSKERELLKKVLAYVVAKDLVVEFEMATQIEETFIEIKELLAQPEREPKIEFRGIRSNGDSYSSQEPVAWMWTRNYEGGGYTNMVFQMLCEAKEYAKDSESLKRPDLVRPLYLGVDDE